MKFIKFVLAIALLTINPAYAQVEETTDEIDVFATVCEKISNKESRSSARLRASDKASFKAVEEIPELKKIKEYIDAHQFNLKIYKLVDNYLEDMSINVVNQNAQEVCVEVNAYLRSSSISEVFHDIKEEVSQGDVLELEQENVEENVNITIPPKPEININEEIAYNETTDAKNNNEDVHEVAYKDISIKQEDTNKKVSVFIDKTLFYNDTSTNGFFAHIEQEILKNKDVEIQAKFDNSNYILKTKVLKAKVDNINSETARLHIVVGVELTDTSNSETITEHQNRFVLFNTSDDAQTKAAELVKALLSDGLAKILPRIKLYEYELKNNNIITPPTK